MLSRWGLVMVKCELSIWREEQNHGDKGSNNEAADEVGGNSKAKGRIGRRMIELVEIFSFGDDDWFGRRRWLFLTCYLKHSRSICRTSHHMCPHFDPSQLYTVWASDITPRGGPAASSSEKGLFRALELSPPIHDHLDKLYTLWDSLCCPKSFHRCLRRKYSYVNQPTMVPIAIDQHSRRFVLLSTYKTFLNLQTISDRHPTMVRTWQTLKTEFPSLQT